MRSKLLNALLSYTSRTCRPVRLMTSCANRVTVPQPPALRMVAIKHLQPTPIVQRITPLAPDLVSKWLIIPQHDNLPQIQLLLKKRKKKKKIIDDCTGRHSRRYKGFNKPCPPPPRKCPPGSTKPKRKCTDKKRRGKKQPRHPEEC